MTRVGYEKTCFFAFHTAMVFFFLGMCTKWYELSTLKLVHAAHYRICKRNNNVDTPGIDVKLVNEASHGDLDQLETTRD